ncbi:saccharopine dehydrogenase family protein [Actinokineospora fastidiosa]|uniref:Saccharopine dehydrogenase n=1 Tax=Actinokineospora fastidiosa TaxID=1816 RepID=A0A918G8L3_9PSEU|nr:saccharopine dehydrogenase NADP-binding domain-containing protein [Actinokineospora fastidiosa]GGS24098.1 saccharopine dehydrogenase [Actinokineospora fastidiosa]
MPTGREYDIVLFGATGFTGELTAEYLARHAPADCRWALAGRNQAKLAGVRSRLASINPALASMDLLTADVNDAASLAAVASATRVVITTVGPYVAYGDPLVAACAAAGTDYVDLTGEPEFVDRTYVRHHATAVASGARLVHACGFDSIPYDLGVYYTVRELGASGPVSVDGFVRASADFSGGTYHSAITAFSRLRESAAVAKERRALETRQSGRRVRGAGRPHRSAFGWWALPAPTVDPQIVLRSARELASYGPDFTYGHYIALRRLPTALGLVGGVGVLFGLAQIPFTRNWLLNRKKPGDGPSPEKRARSWFKVRFDAKGEGKRIVTEVSGGDPGYDETAKMLAESALCLAFDDLPATSGQVTTAVAMGDALLDRLIKAGIAFTVLES